MGKIIKQQMETINVQKEKFTLGMKGEFFIEFVSDRFGPYEYKFQRQDTYFQDALQDRGAKIFPLKDKKFNNTELFFENDDIVLAIGKRESIKQETKYFVDIINIKTEKRYRIFTDEVSLIALLDKGLLINFNDNGIWKTIILNPETMEEIEEKEEKLDVFFKLIYNEKEKKWYVLDFEPENKDLDNLDDKKYQKGVFKFESINIYGEPKKFDRKEWKLEINDGKQVDVWEKSIS